MKTHLNLLPAAYRRRQLVLRHVRQWGLVWSLAALALAAIAWREWSQLRAGRLHVESLRRQCAPLLAARSAVEELQQQIDQLRQREALAFTLADEQSLATLVGRLGLAAQVCHGQIAIRHLQLESAAAGGSAPQGAAPATRLLVLQGVATSHQAVVRFHEELRDSGLFERLELKQTGVTQINGHTATTYCLECTF